MGPWGDGGSRGRQRGAGCCLSRRHQELQETRQGAPLEASGGARPCQRLDFDLLSCKTVRKDRVLFYALVGGLCPGSPGMLTHAIPNELGKGWCGGGTSVHLLRVQITSGV